MSERFDSALAIVLVLHPKYDTKRTMWHDNLEALARGASMRRLVAQHSRPDNQRR